MLALKSVQSSERRFFCFCIISGPKMSIKMKMKQVYDYFLHALEGWPQFRNYKKNGFKTGPSGGLLCT
jgi:hypothetical protein